MLISMWNQFERDCVSLDPLFVLLYLSVRLFGCLGGLSSLWWCSGIFLSSLLKRLSRCPESECHHSLVHLHFCWCWQENVKVHVGLYQCAVCLRRSKGKGCSTDAEKIQLTFHLKWKCVVHQLHGGFCGYFADVPRHQSAAVSCIAPAHTLNPRRPASRLGGAPLTRCDSVPPLRPRCNLKQIQGATAVSFRLFFIEKKWFKKWEYGHKCRYGLGSGAERRTTSSGWV